MSQFKKKLTAFSAMLAFLSLSSAATFAATSADVLGTSNASVIDTSSVRTDVNVNGGAGAVGQVDWRDFSVGGTEHVNFGFSGVSQTVINRVLGGKTSDIQGKLTNSCISDYSCGAYGSTGKVILINPAGVMFGTGSQVDLNSFTVSTFDFNGAKNLEKMSTEAKAAYQADVLNKLSPLEEVAGRSTNLGQINFDSRYTTAIGGINYDENATKQVSLSGAEFNDFINTSDGSIAVDANGNPIRANVNTNKSVAIVSDNITYRDSVVKTGGNYNYNENSTDSSFGNVKLVTADGVTFTYLANGYVENNEQIKDDTRSNVVRNIDIDNTNLLAKDPTAAAIDSGDISIQNKSNANNSNVKIANSIIKARKLVNDENGDIYITASKDINIKDSRLTTMNTNKENAPEINTNSQDGGVVAIRAGENVKMEGTLIKTASSDVDSDYAGNVSITATNGGITIDKTTSVDKTTGKTVNHNSKILSKGDVSIVAGSNKAINIKDTIVQADNTDVVKNSTNNVKISSAGGVDIHNGIVTSSGDVDILSVTSKNKVYGDINITSDLNAEGKNQSFISAGNKISLKSTDTKLDNTSLLYKQISFYGDGTTGTNNVTVANNSTFNQVGAGGDINLTTNGDFTLDNATVQKISGQGLKFDKVGNTKEVDDDGTVHAVKYNFDYDAGNARNITITSTDGDVTAYKASNVKATNDITLNSNNHSVNVKGGTTLDAGRNLNINAHDNIVFADASKSNTNIDKTSKLKAGNNINITSSDGDISLEKTEAAEMTYGKRLAFNATKGSNKITSKDSLKSVNVDYNAGVENNFETVGDIQFTNSSLKAPKNNITTTGEGGDVIMNNLEIKVATTNAKDTVTNINAKGNITTKDVTKTYASDSAATSHVYPQSVDTTFDVDKANSSGSTNLNVNNTKLIATTKTNITSPKNNNNGSIVIDVINAANKDAGIELTAENTPGWDGQIDKNEGPEVHINATDNKLAVSKIVTDKLFTDANDKMYASDVTLTPEQLAGLPEGTPSKGYIEVRDYMGFNQDTDFTTDPTDFDYTGNYVPGKITIPGNNEPIDVNRKHTINFADTNEDFILVYDRPYTAPEPTPEVIVVSDSLINQIKIPREQVEISKTSKVSDNTVDQTANIMSAAAKVDLGQDSEENDEEEFEEAEE